MRNSSRAWRLAVTLIFILSSCQMPEIGERIAWRLRLLRARIQHALNPPEEAIFVPQQQTQTTPLLPAPSLTPAHSPTPPQATVTPQPSPTPTQTPTPLPSAIELSGIRHEYQQWNNCGPAALSMALSYWNWGGNQSITRDYLRPNPEDKNVFPFEMAEFVRQATELEAIVRVGGSVDLLRQLLAAGFPVLVEIGFDRPGEGDWLGHYSLISGYDDSRQRFITQDSYVMPDYPVAYGDMVSSWRAFNFIYLVIYPIERQDEVFLILGEHLDERRNAELAAQKASEEIDRLEGRAHFFAWFNRGDSLRVLEDYSGAAEAFDAAFQYYPSIPPRSRPWRLMWYHTGPYEAYFHTGRYQDVIDLATQTLTRIDVPAIEESFYWRARAREALGDQQGAIRDQHNALRQHERYQPAIDRLKQLGADLP